MLQKIIKVGNSLAVVLPKPFIDKSNYQAGDEISIQTNDMLRALYMRPKEDHDKPGLTPEFKQWLDEIAVKEAHIIKALAKV